MKSIANIQALVFETNFLGNTVYAIDRSKCNAFEVALLFKFFNWAEVGEYFVSTKKQIYNQYHENMIIEKAKEFSDCFGEEVHKIVEAIKTKEQGKVEHIMKAINLV